MGVLAALEILGPGVEDLDGGCVRGCEIWIGVGELQTGAERTDGVTESDDSLGFDLKFKLVGVLVSVGLGSVTALVFGPMLLELCID